MERISFKANDIGQKPALVLLQKHIVWSIQPRQEIWICFKKPFVLFPIICIQDVTQGVTQGYTQDDTLDAWIETQIKNNPKVTTDELASLSNKGVATIKRHLAKLPHIRYVEADIVGTGK